MRKVRKKGWKLSEGEEEMRKVRKKGWGSSGEKMRKVSKKGWK